MDRTPQRKGALTRTKLREAVCVLHVGAARREASELVDVFFEEIVRVLASGEQVELRGFGAFKVRSKRARPGRNPKTMAPVRINARRVVVFKPSPALVARLNH